MLNPADCSYAIVTGIISRGSAKDGANETWREEDVMFHLSKAMSHLATHIRNMHDPRSVDAENHLELALTRLSMAATYPTNQSTQDCTSP